MAGNILLLSRFARFYRLYFSEGSIFCYWEKTQSLKFNILILGHFCNQLLLHENKFSYSSRFIFTRFYFFITKLEIRPREKRGIKDYLEKYEVVKNSWNFRVSNKQNVICFCRKWIRKEKLEMHFKSICHQEVMVCIFYISNPEFDSLYYHNCTYSC